MTRTLFFLVVAAGCAPSLSQEIIRNHPRIKVELIEPQVVEASDPIPPVWTRRLEHAAVAFVSFSGQSSASTMDIARTRARKDLLAAVSSFVAVEVESEFEAVESERTRGGRTESSVEVRSSVRTRSNAALEGIEPAAVYWEKVVDSPLAPDATTYRVYLLAQVPKTEIARARLKRQLERQEKSGKRMVVVLPFSPVLAAQDAGPLAQAFLEEVSRRLAASPNLHVSDPGLVQALVEGKTMEADALETVRDALLPDFVIGGSYQLHGGRLRVTYTLYAGADGRVLGSSSVQKPKEDLFGLQDDLVEALSARLAAEQGTAPGPKAVDPDAYAKYQAASAAYQVGDNAGALSLLEEAIEASPGLAAAHLRLGRVLERLGRYGRIPAKAKPAAADRVELTTCVRWERITDRTFEELADTREGGAEAVEALLSSRDFVNVEHVASALAFVLRGGQPPELPVPPVARSAAGAYWRAFVAARASGDERLELDVLVSLADLFLRVDRIHEAEQTYREVLPKADRMRSIHHASLAHFGLGKAMRVRGRYGVARDELRRALELRGLLGEKPYLLEIYNELGHLGVETADYFAARYFYRRAFRLAEELDHDYLRAVLSNNIGVLLLEEGRLADAEPYLVRAFDYLRDLEEAEGRIASGLNVHLFGATRGDVDRARAYLEETKRLVLATNQESRFAELYAHRGFSRSLGGARLQALRDLLRSWAIYRRLGRPLHALRLANGAAVAEFYETSDWIGTGDEARRFPTACLRDRFHRLLEEGYGFDESQLARDYYWYGRWGYSRPARPPRRHLFTGELGAGYYYTLLNAEVMARIDGGGW